MFPSIRTTAELVSEISFSAREQTNGLIEINTAIRQISQAVQLNAVASEELSATAEEMNTQAAQLKEMMGYFQFHGEPERNKDGAYCSQIGRDSGRILCRKIRTGNAGPVRCLRSM